MTHKFDYIDALMIATMLLFASPMVLRIVLMMVDK